MEEPSKIEKAMRLPKPMRITGQVWPEGSVPVVSIWCITYNQADFIRDAIESFLMQETTFPVEIFVHDDASNDGTAEIVKEYAGRYPQLFWTVFQEQNQYSKGNKSVLWEYLANQRGEFIALCEGDDYWTSPHKLQKQITLLENNAECSLVFHDAYLTGAKVLRPCEESQRMLRSLNQEKFFLRDILRPWFIPTASIVYRRDCIPEVPPWVPQCQSGDIPLQLLCALKGHFLFIKEAMSVYRRYEGGVSAQHTGVNVIASRAYIYESFNLYTNGLYEKELRKAFEMEIRLHTPELYELDRRQPTAWRLYARSIKRRALWLLRLLGIRLPS